MSPYLALLQVGFGRRCVTADDRTLLPSDFALTIDFAPITVPPNLHWRIRWRYVSVPLSVFRIPAESWELPSTLSSGARTFLPSELVETAVTQPT